MSEQPRILVVDDDPAILQLLTDILSAQGFRIDGAPSARRCFELISEPNQPPDLILLDVMLPDISGFDALERIRKSTATSAIPVAVISTLPERSYRRRADELGADEYLQKPFKPMEVVEAVKRLLSNPRSPEAS